MTRRQARQTGSAELAKLILMGTADLDCGHPVTGVWVTGPDDPLGRRFCTEACLIAAAEASYEQRYQPGVTS